MCYPSYSQKKEEKMLLKPIPSIVNHKYLLEIIKNIGKNIKIESDPNLIISNNTVVCSFNLKQYKDPDKIENEILKTIHQQLAGQKYNDFIFKETGEEAKNFNRNGICFLSRNGINSKTKRKETLIIEWDRGE